ncbi:MULTISPECIES: LacI family DNA-binding transcriptional regulator [Paenarthrobacter]|uniref:LacI family DNA-binding transcriptional regulator n=1 Tax=Paenarthrobacter TaxID=1742992 RepID=UPI00074D440B|nr:MULTISPECIES: LacI family DNA-binding transcriptional regulator [Paenarthrobacter]AMB39814.1 LacI family transcriptional regulator [Arthrobacter sp. ATCC 21022]KUR65510.1 LacI family transcriptional regulator [Arthrobacter sp. ATCC 21022]QSZ54737.1 LacI family transcriptional regulator [Paenarthrobacter ureafaciens]RWW96049.1 LacI family transcriptional regulator [Paenarthrobacter ureafaciens]WOC62230.1 LacI family DNA-binding transcriptional regulator [Paenarthrobacter sp. AT5]
MASDRPPRPATQSDVAREVGVSRTLVSFAFRGAPGVSDETKQAIFAAAKRLGYRPNAVAADLARKHRSAVGLYLLDIRNEIYADILSGVRTALSQEPNRLILSVSRSVDGEDRGAVESLIEARVGIIIAATLLDPDEAVHEMAASVPLVSVTRPVAGVDSVYSDDSFGARAAVEHLLTLGHTRIAHLAGPAHDGHVVRRRSYEQAMRRAGLVPQTLCADDFTQESGHRAAARLLGQADRPTAIFCHNDQLALGTREAAYAMGLSIPRDLSLIGYDNSRTAGLHGIDLTSVDLHAARLGEAAGQVALERLRNPEAPAADRRFTPRLVVRSSTARPA